MYNSNRYNEAKYNETKPTPIYPVLTYSAYPKTESKLIVWFPTGDLTNQETTTVFP